MFEALGESEGGLARITRLTMWDIRRKVGKQATITVPDGIDHDGMSASSRDGPLADLDRSWILVVRKPSIRCFYARTAFTDLDTTEIA